jgi:hypothetical protein
VSGGRIIGNCALKEATQPDGTQQSAILHESRDGAAVRRQRLIERAGEFSGVGIDYAYTVSLYGCDRRKRPHLPQPLAGAEWKIKPGRIEAVDDVQVLVTRHHNHARRENVMLCHRVQEFRPFRRPAGVRQIAAYEYEVERLSAMDVLEAHHNRRQASVAARAATSALDAKTVSFTNHMKVCQMSDAPRVTLRRGGIKCGDFAWLIHARIRETPDERDNRHIPRKQHDGISERRDNEPVW